MFATLVELSTFWVWESYKAPTIVTFYAIIIKALPLTQLIVAVLLVRCTLSNLKERKVFDNERLMLVHVTLLSLFLIVFVGEATLGYFSQQDVDN